MQIKNQKIYKVKLNLKLTIIPNISVLVDLVIPVSYRKWLNSELLFCPDYNRGAAGVSAYSAAKQTHVLIKSH